MADFVALPLPANPLVFAVTSVAVTSVAVWIAGTKLARRRDRSILRMGYDSVLLLITYAGVALLYPMRPDQ